MRTASHMFPWLWLVIRFVWLCTGGQGPQQFAVNVHALRRAWESSQRSTKEDWAEWMRHFAVELLKESPSPALRATHSLAQVGCAPLA